MITSGNLDSLTSGETQEAMAQPQGKLWHTPKQVQIELMDTYLQRNQGDSCIFNYWSTSVVVVHSAV
jgi:hypothetical protein